MLESLRRVININLDWKWIRWGITIIHLIMITLEIKIRNFLIFKISKEQKLWVHANLEMQAIWILKKHFNMKNTFLMLKVNNLMKFLCQVTQIKNWISDRMIRLIHLSLSIATLKNQSLIILVRMLAKWTKRNKTSTMGKKIKRNKIIFMICNHFN